MTQNPFTTACVESGAAAGTFYWNLVFKNDLSVMGIELQGTPVVLFLRPDGALWARAGLNEVNPDVKVTLSAGHEAYSLLGVPDPGVFGKPVTKAVNWLLVTLPGYNPALVPTPSPIDVVGMAIGLAHVSAVSLQKL